jgi:hypothetical protein
LLFSKNANEYTKDIVSNVVGGELGLAAGLGVTAAIGAGATAATSGLGAVAGADFWNPVGWAAGIGAGVTALFGAISGASPLWSDFLVRVLFAMHEDGELPDGRPTRLWQP